MAVHHYWIGLIACLLAFNAFAKKGVKLNGTEVSTVEQLTQPLPPGYGYLLLDLDVGGTSPSIALKSIVNNKTPRLSPQIINLKGRKKGFLLLLQKQGDYVIHKVNAPFFNLPYALSTDMSKRWRFHIEAGKVNYIGHLAIRTERTSRHIDINFFNRMATDLVRIKSAYTKLLQQYPLAASHGQGDAFYQYFQSLPGGSKAHTN